MTVMLCPVLVGRVAERDALVARARDGGASMVLGEAGIGKSRLVREVVAAAREGSALVLGGRAVSGGRSAPYRPLAEAIAAACRRGGPPDVAALAPYRAALGRLVPEWNDPERAGSAESTVVLGEGVLRLLTALGGASLVLLVVEDLHWADPESLAVLEYLADHAAEERLHLLGTCRPEPGPGWDLVRDLVARRAATAVELAPLTPAAGAEMARRCLDTDVLPAGVEAVLARADGVPFLVEELLAAAARSGALVRDAARWTFRKPAEPLVPPTLADTIADRIASLDPRDRAVPRAAALLGRRVEVAILAVLLERDPAELLDVLHRCAQLQLLTRDAGGFRFRHALTRDAVVTGSADPALARRARAAIEATYPQLPGRWCGLAAELAVLAGDTDDAASLLLRVGQRAVAAGALATAAAVLDQAGALVPPNTALGRAVAGLRVEVAALAGDVDGAFAAGEALVAYSDPAERARIHVCLAEAAATATLWDAAQEQVDLARTAAPDAPTRARVDALAAQIHLGRAEPAEAEAAAGRALGHSRDPETTCRALEVLGRLARSRDLRDADAMFTRQLAVATDHGLGLWVIRATHELGAVDLMRANDTTRLERARELAVAAGAMSTVTTLDLQLAASAYLRLDGDGCVSGARRCQEAARRFGPELVLAEATFVEAVGHAVAGRWAAMEEALGRAHGFNRPEADLRSISSAHRGVYALLREDRARAIAYYDAAVAALRDSPTVYVRPFGHWWALLHAVVDDGGTEALTEVRTRTAVDSGLTAALLRYGEAVAAGRAGDPCAAERFAEARSHVASPGMAAQRFLAERHVAECALADGWGEPVTWLIEAASFFHTAGHVHVERACRALLRRAGVALPSRNHRRVPADLAALGVTDREAEVLALVAEGLTSREVASRLYLSARTVDKHVEHLLAKTGLTRRAELRRLRT